MPNRYIPRLVDEQLEDYLSTFGAVSVEGPKWCGKTTTASQHARSKTNMADPTGSYQARRLATLEPSLALQGDRPRLIDEWQEVPSIWDAVRYQVDSDGEGRSSLRGQRLRAKTPNPPILVRAGSADSACRP